MQSWKHWWLGSLLFWLVASTPLAGRVIWWENFEDSTLSRITWHGSVSLAYDPPYVQDDPAGFRRQNHGIVSLQLTSLADDTTWVRFPVCEGLCPPAVVELYLNLPEAGTGLTGTVWDLGRLRLHLLALDADHYALQIEDSTGTHLFDQDSLLLVPDTVVHPQNWYRIQVLLTDTLDFVYLNGRQVGTGFRPLQATLPDSTRLCLPAGGTGTLLVDDYLVSAPDIGLHPSLLFGLEDLPILLFKTTDSYTGTSGIAPAELWDSLQARANRYLETDTLVLLDGEVRYPYPFPWPPPLWSGLLYQAHIPHWIQSEGFVHALLGDSAHAAKVRGILRSLSNWPQLEWPFYYHNPTPLYMETDGFHYLLALTIGYDLVYDALSDFDRMSLENVLLVKGVQQADLALRVGVLSERPVRSNKALVGATALLLTCLMVEDSAYTAGPLATARGILQDFFSNPVESFGSATGDARENSFFASYAFVHLAMAAQALERRGETWLRDQMLPFTRYRTTLALPGWRLYPPVGDNSAVIQGFMEQTPELFAYLASHGNDPLAQWYLSKISGYTFDYGQGLWGDYLIFGTFLWLDNTQSAASPEALSLSRLQRFPVVGLAVYRSAWEDPRTLFVALKARDAGAFHNHLDNNTLYIALGNRWVIGEDTYRNRPYTEGHSTLQVFWNGDTLGQVWRTDGGTLWDPYRDSSGVLLEAEAQGSYQTVSLFHRRVWILPQDTLVLVWDRIVSPPEYAARYQLRYHLFGTPQWHGDTLWLLQDSLAARLLWLSPYATAQGLETRPTDTVWTITSLADSTDFEGVAVFDLAPAATPSLPEFRQISQGTGLWYQEHRLLEVNPILRDSVALLETHGSRAFWTFLNLRPYASYLVIYVGDSTAGYDSLTTDGYGRAGLLLQAPEDTVELILLWADRPCYPTRPTASNRIYGRDTGTERWIFARYHRVFDRWIRYGTDQFLDIGDFPALTTDHEPWAAYYRRRRGRWELVLQNLETRSALRILNEWADSLEIQREPLALYSIGDTLWLAHWLVRPDSTSFLLLYRSVGDALAVDTLDRSPVPPPALSTPSFAALSPGLWLLWIHPDPLRSRLHLARIRPDSTEVDSLWPLRQPGGDLGLYAEGTRLFLAWHDGDTLWYSLREGDAWRTPEAVDTALGHPVFLTSQHLLVSSTGKRPAVLLYTFNGARYARSLTLSDEGSGFFGTGRVLRTTHDAYRTRVLWSTGNPSTCLHDTLLSLRPRNFVNGHLTGTVLWRDTVFVNGDLVIDSGAVLRLLPGTVVQVTPYFDYLQGGRDPNAVELLVQGTLVAHGTAREPVYLRGEGAAGSWLGLRIAPGGHDTLIHTRLYDAEHGIVAEPGSELFLDTVYLWNLRGWAVVAESAFVEIYRSYLLAPRGTLLEGCAGTLQSTSLQGRPQALTVRNPSGYLLLEDNRVYISTPIGILLESTGRRVDLFGNHVQSADLGVSLVNSSPLMAHNEVQLTRVASVWAAGPSAPRLYQNLLHSRRFTVVATDGARPVLGAENDSHSGENSILGDSLRVVYSPTEPVVTPLKAENNWWGTASPAPSLFLGPVDYIPYLTAPPGPARPAGGGPLQVMLNPGIARRWLHIEATTAPTRPLAYEIYDAAGRRVRAGTLPPGQARWRLALGRLPAGVYFLRLYHRGRILAHRRFVKL